MNNLLKHGWVKWPNYTHNIIMGDEWKTTVPYRTITMIGNGSVRFDTHKLSGWYLSDICVHHICWKNITKDNSTQYIIKELRYFVKIHQLRFCSRLDYMTSQVNIILNSCIYHVVVQITNNIPCLAIKVKIIAKW